MRKTYILLGGGEGDVKGGMKGEVVKVLFLLFFLLYCVQHTWGMPYSHNSPRLLRKGIKTDLLHVYLFSDMNISSRRRMEIWRYPSERPHSPANRKTYQEEALGWWGRKKDCYPNCSWELISLLPHPLKAGKLSKCSTPLYKGLSAKLGCHVNLWGCCWDPSCFSPSQNINITITSIYSD